MAKIPVVPPARVVDHEVAGPARPDDLAKLSAPLTNMLTSELDEARRYLGVRTDELLIAALGCAIAKTIGDGVVGVDDGRGWSIPLTCISTRRTDATEVLRAVHRTLVADLRADRVRPRADIFFSYTGAAAEPSSVQLPPADMVSDTGYALAVRAYRSGDLLQMDWWYDARRLDQATVDDLTAQFPLALIELTSEATPPSHHDAPLAMA